jgi:hypothetical protein
MVPVEDVRVALMPVEQFRFAGEPKPVAQAERF